MHASRYSLYVTKAQSHDLGQVFFVPALPVQLVFQVVRFRIWVDTELATRGRLELLLVAVSSQCEICFWFWSGSLSLSLLT